MEVSFGADDTRMCGIAGFLLRQGEAKLAGIRAMCDCIRHRGPDDEGYHLDGGCALGMRRLSIVDLASGHQPMTNEDGSVWVVFNGEIYNHKDLRADLIQRGHRFTTSSDTETLVHLYEQQGKEGLSRLRGMFAYAVWDARHRKLLLARDRFGKKPLYYTATRDGLWFASELKCLMEAGVPQDLDRNALRLYFQFGYIPDPHSPFKAVRKLEPGGWLEYSTEGHLALGRYWRLPPPAEKAEPGFTPAAATERLRELFDESVKLRMEADVPLGAFLSGGIDSSSVVASMSRQSNEPVKTFSIGFEESAYSELPFAAMVAAKFSTEHHEIVLRPDVAGLVSQMVRWFDEPFADTAAIPTYLLSRFAREHVKVALSGDGGDELFGGYDSFRKVQKLSAWDWTPGVVRQAISGLSERLPYSAYGKNFLRVVSRPSALERYFEMNYAPFFLREQLLEPQWMLPADAAFLTHTFADCLVPGEAGALTQAMYFEATANLTGGMLVKVDRASMAASIEVRCPLLDHELAEFAARIPHSWKIRQGRGKDILIRALGDRLPASLLSRPKRGFEPPFALWLRGPLREMLWDHLTSESFLGRGIVSGPFVEQLLREHESGRRDNNNWLWSLLVLEIWFRELQPARAYAEAC